MDIPHQFPLTFETLKEFQLCCVDQPGFKSQIKSYTYCCSQLYGKSSFHASIWPVNNIYACTGSNYLNLQASRVTMPMKFVLKLMIALTLKPLSIIQITKAFTLYCPEQGLYTTTVCSRKEVP